MVLVAGGEDDTFNVITNAELYNPTSGSFTATGSLNQQRSFHMATLLNDGTVLLAGGMDTVGTVVNNAELYDPTTAAFTATSSMSATRYTHTATLLNKGKVLVAGGYDNNYDALASSELYDPTTGSFTATGSLGIARGGQTATLLTNNTVLMVGGVNGGNIPTAAELYDPTSGTFVAAGNTTAPRYIHTAALLGNGTTLIAGGWNSQDLTSAELYQPSTLTPPGLVSIAVHPSNPSVTVGAVQPFTATGTFSDSSTQPLASVTWSSSNISTARISNDASNHGNAFAVAAGTATISACTGSICGSTTMTVPTLLSITLTPSNPSIAVDATSQLKLTATGVYSDSTSRDITAIVTWTTSNSAVASVMPSPFVHGVVAPAAAQLWCILEPKSRRCWPPRGARPGAWSLPLEFRATLMLKREQPCAMARGVAADSPVQ